MGSDREVDATGHRVGRERDGTRARHRFIALGEGEIAVVVTRGRPPTNVVLADVPITLRVAPEGMGSPSGLLPEAMGSPSGLLPAAAPASSTPPTPTEVIVSPGGPGTPQPNAAPKDRDWSQIGKAPVPGVVGTSIRTASGAPARPAATPDAAADTAARPSSPPPAPVSATTPPTSDPASAT